MADIKPEFNREKPLSYKENLAASPEKYAGRPEAKVETEKLKNLEQARKEVIEEIMAGEDRPAAAAPSGGVLVAQVKRQKQVEAVLAAGLKDIYINLAPAKQQEFKRAGEETAKKISLLLGQGKIKIREIIKLIKKWLALIPGLNKYFLEKEAKIKADEILKMKNLN